MALASSASTKANTKSPHGSPGTDPFAYDTADVVPVIVGHLFSCAAAIILATGAGMLACASAAGAARAVATASSNSGVDPAAINR
eukprot:8590526-Alexandrium_andersonii.AAC.1